MTGQYPFLASRLFGVPLMVHPAQMHAIVAAVGPRMGIDVPEANPVGPALLHDSDSAGVRRPYQVQNGTAIIPVMGNTIARGDFMESLSGMVSYQRLQALVRQAEGDDGVDRMVLDMSSMGGEVELCFETADVIANIDKPVIAVSHDRMASAAYGLASAASEIYATSSAYLGSIGVVLTHVSQQKRNDEQGYLVEHIFEGSHKVDMSPHFDLTESARDEARSLVTLRYEQFVAQVAAGRDMDPADVKATKARMFGADDALKLGLIDGIRSFDDVVRGQMQLTVASEVVMTDTKASAAHTTVAELSAAYPSLCETITEGARALGAHDERERIKAIQDHPEAEGREALARQLSLTEGMTADAAGPILMASPKIEAAAPKASEDKPDGETPFRTEMANHDPSVSATVDAPTPGSQAAIDDSWKSATAGASTAQRIN